MKRQDELNAAWCKQMGEVTPDIMRALAFALRWCDAHPFWHNAKDDLPEEFDDVWAIRDDGNGGYFDMGIYRYIGEGLWEAAPHYIACVDDVTHWMPLPEMPKKGG